MTERDSTFTLPYFIHIQTFFCNSWNHDNTKLIQLILRNLPSTSLTYSTTHLHVLESPKLTLPIHILAGILHSLN